MVAYRLRQGRKTRSWPLSDNTFPKWLSDEDFLVLKAQLNGHPRCDTQTQ
jgi:hypothetical protein